MSDADGAATLAAFTIEATAAAARPFALAPKRWLVCGGGRRNPTLMKGLAARLATAVEPIEAIGFDGDVVEAQCFAYLALRSRARPADLAADHDRRAAADDRRAVLAGAVERRWRERRNVACAEARGEASGLYCCDGARKMGAGEFAATRGRVGHGEDTMATPHNFLAELVGCFATPAAENPTVAMIESAFRHHGMNARYINCEVRPEALGDAARGARAMGWRGFNCSIPHKVAIIAHLDGLGDSAATIGAVNCAVRRGDKWIGENTDGVGFMESLRTLIDVKGKSMVVFGAGGAARAIAVEAALAGARRIDHRQSQPGARRAS